MKRWTTLLCLLAMLCALLCACQTGGASSAEGDRTPAAESADKSEGTQSQPSDGGESTLPEPESPPLPVDIETDGGVVVVGRIGFDEKGWHIVPEQPLNITYSYFLEKPSVFPAQTRVSMIDPKDDGVDKAAYLGQTVTVYGTFRFVRDDFETLYLAPYTITVGKTVAGSYGDSDLAAPDVTADRYDRSLPLPECMAPQTADGGYTYNAYMLSEESLQLMGNDFAPFYCDFVDAILNYKSEVHCPDASYAELLGSVIYYDFPLFDACAQPFEYFRHYDRETGTIRIEYKYSKAEHDKLLDRLLQAANEMLAAVTPDMDEVEKAKSIYHALCTRVSYDDSALEDFERKNSHYAYLNNSGVCVTFANVYNQLLTQVGIKTTLASCNYDATMGHVWSVVTLEGENYFCDPTFELSYDKGSGYRYFGLNYADKTKDGVGEDGITIGKYWFTTSASAEMLAEQSLTK